MARDHQRQRQGLQRGHGLIETVGGCRDQVKTADDGADWRLPAKMTDMLEGVYQARMATADTDDQYLARPDPKTHVMYKANVNCSVLKEYLQFLIEQGLVEEKTVGKRRVAYAINSKGLIVLKQFRELKQILPLVEEEQRERPFF